MQVTLFLWRKAASDLYKEAEGSLLLLWSPQVSGNGISSRQEGLVMNLQQLYLFCMVMVVTGGAP